MTGHKAGTDEFIQQFNDFPLHRHNIIIEFIKANNRLLLNIPTFGPARQISARLREGPFSGFYEFENELAGALHPVLAGLKLNIISDILINAFFSEKYRFYSRDINFMLAANKKPGLGALKSIILGMVERDGHYMVVKFYDLVLRPIDADLFRALKPVELCIIEIKKNLDDGGSENTGKVLKIYKRFKKTYGVDAARLLLKRMEWDHKLASNVPRQEEDLTFTGISGEVPADAPPEATSAAGRREEETDTKRGGDGTAEGPMAALPWKRKVARYAELIKEGYLIKKEPSDEEGIRGIVEGMAVKNEKVSGQDRAADIVRHVLAVWIEDDSLDEGMRRTLAAIRDERQGGPEPEEEYTPEKTAPPVEAPDENGTGAINEGKMAEASLPGDEAAPMEAGVSDEERSAILKGISDEPQEQDGTSESKTAVNGSFDARDASSREPVASTGIPDHGAVESAPAITGEERREQGDDEKFLISDEEIPELAKSSGSQGEDEEDGSFLISDEEMAGEMPEEVPGEATEEESADQTFIEDMIAADELVVQDELLYEDKSLKRKYRKDGEKPGDKH